MTRYAPGAPTRSIREEAVDANASVSEVFLPVGKSGGGAAAKKKLKSKPHSLTAMKMLLSLKVLERVESCILKRIGTFRSEHKFVSLVGSESRRAS